MRTRFFTLSALAVAAIALLGCNKVEEENIVPQKNGIPFEFTASGVDTKTATDGVHTTWVSGDKVNLFHAVAGSTSYVSDGAFTANADGASVTFTGTLGGELTADNYDWYAIYPYNSNNSTPKNTGTKGYVIIGSTATDSQTQTGNSDITHIAGNNYPVAGKVLGVSKDGKPSIAMSHLTSIIAVKVTNGTTAPITVSSVSFTGTEDIVGTYYIDFVSSPVVYTKSGDNYVSKTANLNVTGGSAIAAGGNATFYLAIKPFTAPSGKEISLTINADKGIKFRNKVLDSSTTFAAGKINTLNFTYDDTANSIIYSTAFNYPIEGSAYNSEVPIEGADPTGTKWYITYGNWNGSNCAQLRVYGAGNFGVIYNDFDCSGVTKVFYDAKVSNTALKLNTYYSTDSGSNWTKVDDGKELTTEFAKYSFDVSATGAFPKVRIKFEVAGTKPSSSNYQLTIDNVVICGNGNVILSPSITADNITGIPAIGVTDENATYTIHNFSGADDIVATCDGTVVTDADVDNAGNITFSVAPNYGSASRSNGTITLTSATEGVDKVIQVSQNGETFSASAEVVTIEKDATTASFTITTPSFGWNATATPADGKNLTISGATSGAASASAQTITVSSTTAVSSSEQTLGTIVVYRNGNTSDTQKKTITIKKASNVVASTYTKVTSISEGTYLICNAAGSRVISGVSDYLTTSAVSISGSTIIGNDTLTDCEFTITALTGSDAGKYSIVFDGKYIAWNTSTKVSKSETLTDKCKWTIDIDSNGFAIIEQYEGSGTKYRYWGWASSNNQYRPYQQTTGSYTNTPLPTLFKKN